MKFEIEVEPLVNPRIDDIVFIKSVYGAIPVLGRIIRRNEETKEVTISFSCGYHVDTYKIENCYQPLSDYL